MAETVAAFLIAGLASGAPAEAIIGWTSGFIGMWAFGLTRRAYLLRAVEAEQALEQARRAHAAETQAAALAERARIAREIHDVLAHALAAVSVNLQAAEGLLDARAGQGPGAGQGRGVRRAGRGAHQGGHGGGPPRHPRAARRRHRWPPATVPGGQRRAGDRRAGERLAARLRALADEHRAAGDAAVEFTVTGTPRPLGADARADRVPDGAGGAHQRAQARAGPAGQPRVGYAPDGVTLEVSNPLPAPGTRRARSPAPGSGYGLTGLRERAALAAARSTAAPADGRWTVRLRLPG